MSQIIELQPAQSRQFIDAETVFLELLRVQAEQEETRGSMFWREVSGVNYLVRESSGGAQKSLGPESERTTAIFEKFQSKKAGAVTTTQVADTGGAKPTTTEQSSAGWQGTRD